MTLGTQADRRDRARRRRWWIAAVILSGLVAVTVTAGAGLYGYDTGTMMARQEVARLEDQARLLSGTIAELRQSNQQLTAALEVLELRELEWKRRFEADPAAGVEAELLDLIRRRRAEGVDAERLRLVIGAIPTARACDPRRISKRLTVATWATAGPGSAGGYAEASGPEPARFADDTVAVTVEGAPAADAAGNPVAWFEPSQPVTVRIARVAGETEELYGLLPLRHSLVVDDSEYRFGFAAGGRGLVEVTFERCRFP